MTPQPMTNETAAVLTSNGINFPQNGDANPTLQGQDSLKKRLKAEIKVIGAIQIMCGVMVLSFGIILASVPFSPYFTPMLAILVKTGYPFVGPLCFVICGSMSIITEKKSTKPLVHSSLALSILGTLLALMGTILLSVKLAFLGPAARHCELSQESEPTPYYGFYHYYDLYASRHCFTLKASLTGVLSVMLICTVLELGLAVLSALLWWKQARSDFPGTVIFLPQSRKERSMSSRTLCDSGYEELLKS